MSVAKLLNFGVNVLGTEVVIDKPLIARNIWTTHSNVYYVDKRVTSSGNGRSWTYAYKTIAEAIAVMNARIDWSETPWAVGDICFIGPGSYDENLTSMPYGATLIGAGHDMRDGQQGTKIAPSTGDCVDVGAMINTRLINIGFIAPASKDCIDAEIMNNNMLEGCYLSGPAETQTARGIVTNDAVMNKIVGCQFSCLDKGIDVNYADGGDSFSHNLIRNDVFDQIDSAGIEISTLLVGPSSKVIGCDFFGGSATMLYAIDDNSGILDVSRCNAEASNGFDGVRSVNASYLNGSLQS